MTVRRLEPPSDHHHDTLWSVRRAATFLRHELRRTPTLTSWSGYVEPAAPMRSPGDVRTTFLGVSTVLIGDGTDSVLIDGFFSRPSVLRLAGRRVVPDVDRVRAGLRTAGITNLRAVAVAHSHFDHAMDAATVAKLTGADVYGSQSTRQIALGDGLPDNRIHVVTPGEPITFGRFTLTALPARHSPGDVAPGSVATPLGDQRRLKDYRTGDCYSFHLAHRDRSLLVHASANYIPDALRDVRADTIFLGVGVLAKQSDAFRDTYWRETVLATGAKRVLPIHWDNFTRALHRPLRPLPRPLDDIPAALTWLTRRAAADGIALALPNFAHPTDPWPTAGPTTEQPAC